MITNISSAMNSTVIISLYQTIFVQNLDTYDSPIVKLNDVTDTNYYSIIHFSLCEYHNKFIMKT